VSYLYEAIKKRDTTRATKPGEKRSVTGVNPAAEGLRDAYERLGQVILGAPDNERHQVILVASSIAGEGASTIARNLAFTLGRTEEDAGTVLVDANLRSPSQHGAFGLAQSPGFRELVSGEATLEQVLKEGIAPELSLIQSGQGVEGEVILLTVTRLRVVIDQLRSRFRWIVFDAPPATVYPDAATLGAVSDSAILVVEAERTRREVANEARRLLSASGVSFLGAVINRRRFHIPDFLYRML
jgi:capsular exopolysaccharide synthesis family protein